MSSGAKQAAFCSDLHFCPMCGSVLPSPALGAKTVPCSRCPFHRNVQEYRELVEEFEIQFNTPKYKKEKNWMRETASSAETEREDFLNPTVDRQCPRCGHSIMYYTTKQTRSADEGQTVFYTCVKCRFQDIEYS